MGKEFLLLITFASMLSLLLRAELDKTNLMSVYNFVYVLHFFSY